MNLITYRDNTAAKMEAGYVPSFLKTYKGSRDSEMWRSSSLVEELCEYILYLERIK